MGDKMNLIDKAVKILNKKYKIINVDVAIVSGSGLAKSIPELENKIVVSYEELGLPTSKVKGHSGNFVFGSLNGKKIAIVSRMHYYESGNVSKVLMPLSIIAKLNTKTVVLLTSSGGVNKKYIVGDLMLIRDQLNLSGINPLIGLDDIKFVNMLDCYNAGYREVFKAIAKEHNIDIQEGVHTQTSGPSYETRAEIEMIRMLNGDAVSMSTAHDCIIANYYDMKVLGIAVIVNVFEATTADMSHQEVLDNAEKAGAKLKLLLTEFINKL